jgi:hypothetical protein
MAGRSVRGRWESGVGGRGEGMVVVVVALAQQRVWGSIAAAKAVLEGGLAGWSVTGRSLSGMDFICKKTVTSQGIRTGSVL